MEKCKIYINNRNGLWDSDVFIIIELPTVPRIGETFWLTNNQLRELEKKASMSKTKNDYDDYRYASNNEINFDDVVQVYSVLYNCDDPEYIYLALSTYDFHLKDINTAVNRIIENIDLLTRH